MAQGCVNTLVIRASGLMCGPITALSSSRLEDRPARARRRHRDNTARHRAQAGIPRLPPPRPCSGHRHALMTVGITRVPRVPYWRGVPGQLRLDG